MLRSCALSVASIAPPPSHLTPTLLPWVTREEEREREIEVALCLFALAQIGATANHSLAITKIGCTLALPCKDQCRRTSSWRSPYFLAQYAPISSRTNPPQPLPPSLSYSKIAATAPSHNQFDKEINAIVFFFLV